MTDRRQIYLVDDDDAVRRSAGFMLKTSGFAVEPFASGVEFLKGVEALAPGCILLDVRMPGMDGLEVQRALRQWDRGQLSDRWPSSGLRRHDPGWTS